VKGRKKGKPRLSPGCVWEGGGRVESKRKGSQHHYIVLFSERGEGGGRLDHEYAESTWVGGRKRGKKGSLGEEGDFEILA